MVFHTARALAAADGGDRGMARVLRILTPLVKFRTCRDARKVAGDAMEVRGGCGYIEEFSDARSEDGLAAEIAPCLDRAFSLARRGADAGSDEEARRAASGLYHASAAVFMAWEAARMHGTAAEDRATLARLVLSHRLLPRDPLAPAEDEDPHLPGLLARAAVEPEAHREAAG